MKIHLIISDSYYFIKDTLENVYNGFSNVIKVDYNTYQIDELLYEFSSISLFDDKKIVVVENSDKLFDKTFYSEDLDNYLNNPIEQTTVIFIANKVDKTNKHYKKILSDYKVYDSSSKNKYNLTLEVKEYVKNHKSHISDKALNYIKDACLNNYDLMLKEIDKLLILGKDNISDELVYGLVALTPDGNNNRFINDLLDMDEQDALICVKNMEILNIDITKLIALITWNLRVTYLIKHYRKDKNKLNEVLKLYNIKDFAYNNFVRRGNLRSEVEILDLIYYMSDIEISIKNFSIDKDKLGYYLINLFCI